MSWIANWIMAWVGKCLKCGGRAILMGEMGWYCKKCGYLRPDEVEK